MKKLFSKLSVLMLGALAITGVSAAKTTTTANAEDGVVRIYFTGVESWVVGDVYAHGVLMEKTVSSYGGWVADIPTDTDITSLKGPDFAQGAVWFHPNVDDSQKEGDTYINQTFKVGYQYTVTCTGWHHDGWNNNKYYNWNVSGEQLIQAPEEVPEKGTEEWSIIGTVQNPTTGIKTNWNADIPFDYNADEDRYEVKIYLEAGDQFKLRMDGSKLNSNWAYPDGRGGVQIGWHDEQAGDKANYLQNDGTGNFKVKAGCTNWYLLMLADENPSSLKQNSDFTLEPVNDDVVDPTPDPEKGTEAWGLIGSMAESNWSTDIPLTYNEDANRYELTTYLTEGDQFKLRLDGKWDKEIGWHDDEAGEKVNYFEEGTGTTESPTAKNGNFRVKEGCSGTYLFKLDDTKVAANKTNADLKIELLAEPDPEKGTEAWGLIGSMAESDWSTDIPLTYNEEENRYEVKAYLEAGDQFKLRLDGKWDKQIGWHDDEAGEKVNYFEEGTGTSESLTAKNGNFKVKEGCSNWYLLKLDDTKTAANKTNADLTVEVVEGPIVSNRTNIEFGEEGFDGAYPCPMDELVYWNNQGWGNGCVVEVSEHYLEDDVAHFTFKTTNGQLDYGFQVFYRNSSLEAYKDYTLTFDLVSSVAGTIKVNHDYDRDIVVGMNHISVTYREIPANASLALIFNTDIAELNEEVSIELSNMDWNEPLPVVDPQEEADAFLADWYALRDSEGSICTANPNDVKDLIARYDALDAEVKAIVDVAEDGANNTVKNSVEYMRAYLNTADTANNEQSTTGLLLSVAKENKATIAIVVALIAVSFAGFVVLNKKRKLVK